MLCEPRWETPRTPSRPTFGHQIVEAAKWLGTPLMPWQAQVALVGGEYDRETGIPCYPDVVWTIHRQAGKTTLVLSWEVQRARGWERFGPQRIMYSAQSERDAWRKLVEDQVPVLEPRMTRLGIKRVLTGAQGAGVEFANGSRVVLLASKEASGHGKTLDLGVKDELFADHDHRRDQAMVPAMLTRPTAQMLAASTMGTDESVPLNEAVERGRLAVEMGERSGVAYFEWSAEESDDPDDPATWARCMPALGQTVTVEAVRRLRASLPLAEFRRSCLNMRDSRRAESVIADEDWRACLADRGRRGAATVVDPVAVAFDVTPDRAFAAVAVAGATQVGGKVQGEITDHRPGTRWVVPRLLELQARWNPSLFVCDAAGPANSVAADAEQAGMAVKLVTTREHTQACGGLLDDVKDGRFQHRGQRELDAAVEGAAKRRVGDTWLWSRTSSSVDISPLVAVTLARWGHLQPAPVLEGPSVFEDRPLLVLG